VTYRYTDTQTDAQAHDDSIYRANTESRGKKEKEREKETEKQGKGRKSQLKNGNK